MTDFLITSALPYVNGAKHLGNLIGSLLPADVHARFRRQLGDSVLFICGTDEHGAPAELGAAAAGLDVRAYCDGCHALQADIYRRFGLSFDHFGRTSSLQNRELTQRFYRLLDDQGLIEERSVEQVWSPADGRFLPDRYVLGVCPHCGCEFARGDQCDGCGRLLDPTELIAPRSALSGETALETRDSRHLFLRQSLLAERLTNWLDSRSGWPPFVASLARGLLTNGLEDRCISRDLAWGIPVPRPGFEGKVFYVWFDAPIGYIAATKEWAEAALGRDWRRWWDPDSNVRYIQFLGKDNVFFHAASFPATLIGSGEPWRTVDVIKGFHWLQYEGGKFSTSARRGVFTDRALEQLPSDLWRWQLVANAPETADVDFSVSRFANDVNKDLADILGNLVNRTLRFANQSFDGRIPSGGEPGEEERAVAARVTRLLADLREHHEDLEFRRATATTRAIWDVANAHFQHSAPWAVLRSNPERAAAITRTSLNLVRICAVAAWSIVPNLSQTILRAFGDVPLVPQWPDADVAAFLDGDAGRPITPPDPLVQKIDDANVRRLQTLFGGNTFLSAS